VDGDALAGGISLYKLSNDPFARSLPGVHSKKDGEMDNKYLFAVVGGVFLFLWFWVGLQPHYAAEGGGIDEVYLFIAVLVLALGGGDSEGKDLISALTGSITGFIPKFIGLTIAVIVGSGLYNGLVAEGGFRAMALVDDVGTLFASGILIILTVACLKKAS
jgi:hypothetical protein